MDKRQLRQFIREKKRAMTPEQIELASKKLTELFLATEEYRAAKTIYGYLPYNQEVRTIPLLRQALLMRFILLPDLDRVARGYSGIPEPIDDGPVADDPTALVLMPGLAFDKDGRRIGYGGGFYDKFLTAEPTHPTVALCYEFQIVPHIPAEEFDVPVGRVLWA